MFTFIHLYIWFSFWVGQVAIVLFVVEVFTKVRKTKESI